MKIFLKTGCIVCALFLLGALFYEWIHSNIYITTSAHPDPHPISHLNTEQAVIALTFDTAAGIDSTDNILDILDKYKITATFFITGGWAEKNPDTLKRIADSGYELGNHSENHKNMESMSDEECRREIMSVHEAVKSLTGVEMDLFRPPYGACNSQLIQSAEDCGYATVSWNCDSMDWKDYGAETIVKTVCENPKLKNGSIIRMNCSAKYTPEALETIISNLKERGFQFKPLSEYL